MSPTGTKPDLRTPAADTGLSIATGYRHLHEALDVIAAHSPDPGDALARARTADLPFARLDGTLVPTDRVAARAGRCPAARLPVHDGARA